MIARTDRLDMIQVPEEWERVRSTVEDVVGVRVYIAGGCLRDLYADRPDNIKDIDLWIDGALTDFGVLSKLDNTLTSWPCLFSLSGGPTYGMTSLKGRGLSAVYYIVLGDLEVNIIFMEHSASNPRELIEGFDFDINQIAHRAGVTTATEGFIKAHDTQTMGYLRSEETPSRKAERVARMKTKYPTYTFVDLGGVNEDKSA